MKIGFDVNALAVKWSGIKHYTLYLLNALMKVDKENEYLLYSRESFSDLDPLEPNFRYCSVPSRWHWRLGLRSELRKGEINIFHSANPAPPPIRGCKFIFTAHDLCFKANRHWVPFRTYCRLTLYKALAFRLSHKIIAISESTKHEIMKYYKVPEDKIRVVYYGIDHDIFKPIEAVSLIEAAKQRYGIEDDFIIYAGIINVRKNITRLLQAFSLLKKEHKFPHKLVLAGEESEVHPDVSLLLEQLDLRDEVLCIGFVPQDDLPLLYNGAELLIYPSLYEGFGLPLLEAMACGTPVITSNISSMAEVAGDAGLLVDPYNVDAMAQGMYLLLSDTDLRNKLREKGLQRAQEFTWEKAAKETLEVYEEVHNR